MILSCQNISKAFVENQVLKNVSFHIEDHEKAAIVGINGAGKTTLLRIIVGEMTPDDGQVVLAKDKTLGYLAQNSTVDTSHTIYEELLSVKADLLRLEEKIRECENNMKHADGDALEDLMKQYTSLTHAFETGGGYLYRSELVGVLKGLGFTEDEFSKPVATLSGGQKTRVALGRLLLQNPDLIILDEPTNHLDYEMVVWLEDYLRRFRGAIIMITHDRYFLDSVCNRIVEVDKGQTYSYDTNYSGFLELKAAREESERASERKRQSILRKEIEWMQRGARARSTKQKAHIQRYEALRDQKGPQTDARVELSSVSSRMGRTTIELHDISKAYGDIVCVKNFTYIFLKNDRIGFVGKNGCGKSTLMKIIAGFIEPDSGEVEIGQTIKIGYFGQEVDIEPELRVIDYVKEAAEFVRTADGLVSASAMLERFLFPPEQQYSPVGKLSGGEKRRLYLLRVLMSAPNVLILDEPTNDLDVETLAILEDYLDGYDGIVITVSHDRYFLDRIAKRIFAFEGVGKIVQYEGGYTDYMNKRPQPASGKTVSENASSTGASASGAQGNTASDGTDSKEARKKKSMETWGHEKKLKFTYKEQKEYETIEADIEKLENRLSEIDDEMVKNATNFGKLNELTKEKEDLEGQLMEKMERWEYLEDLAQKIANLT